MNPKTKLLNQKVAGLAGALLVLVLGLVLLHVNSRAGLSLRFASYDWAYDLGFLKDHKSPESDIFILYVDEASHQALKQQFNRPWDRSIHARLLDRLTEDRAQAAVFDIVFSDPGPDPAADRALAGAIRRNGHVILAADLVANQSVSDKHTRARETTLTAPYEDFANAAAGWGIAQLQPDEDFLVREHTHGPYDSPSVSLSWATARMLGLPSAANPQARFDERWVNYYSGPNNFQSMSYRRAFDMPKGYFRDKIVFIGGRPQAGLLRERKDQFRSPYTTWFTDPLFVPAVDVHATMLLNLIRADWLRKLPPVGEWLFLSLGALFFGFGLTRFRPSAAAGVALLGVAGFAVLALAVFGLARIWLPWMIVVAAQAPAGLIFAISYKSIEWYVLQRSLEEQQKKAQTRIREQVALLDKARDAIMVHDLSWHTAYWNPSAEQLYGWSAAEVTAQPVGELLYRGNKDKFAEVREAVLAKGEWCGELRQTTKSGKTLLVESRWTRVCDDDGNASSILGHQHGHHREKADGVAVAAFPTHGQHRHPRRRHRPRSQ